MAKVEEKKEEIEVEIPGVRVNYQVPARKIEYAKKLDRLLEEYKTCLIVTVTNVGSSQIGEMRKDLRKQGRFLFGKNVKHFHDTFYMSLKKNFPFLISQNTYRKQRNVCRH
ncbi:hypothetical protein RFI_14708 [Reticulomyxa filosa]|uniref:60S ribosomal protein L10P insertion domain-containing protein n=1 Tax=Reticulomyxa filosa TaxID=46433 RepID=X6NB03_RETFI|nr:hypothetical protein RFI_14708 [Reticulomyxa filosa]|eukprot:ETO22492.1 hypothetical protein RFI_14708 [Reticulomyxa filosa]